nr:hypothetical protein [Parabacteroides goldsteinii]
MIITRQYGRLAHFCITLLLPCLLAGSQGGCTREEPLSYEEPGQPVMISLSNRAINAGVSGEQVNTLRILLVNRNNIDRTVVCNRFVSSPTDPLLIKVVSGMFDVYVVANEMPDGTEFTPLQDVRNLTGIRQVALPYSPADRNMENIPMFGKVEQVNITAPAGEVSSTNPASVTVAGVSKGDELPVSLTRMASKVKLTLKQSNGTLKAVEFNNLPDKIPLFDDTYITPDTRPVKTVETGKFSPVTSSDPAYPIASEQADILLPSWIFSDKTNSSQAIQLKATVTEDTGDKSYSSAIGHATGSSDVPKDYTILRNKDYTLTAFITNNTVTVGASVSSWTDLNLSLEDDKPVIPPAAP